MSNLTHIVSIVHEDIVLATYHTRHPMAYCLKFGWAMIEGMPSAECCIRRNGDMAAYLKTNWRGDLEEAEMHVHRHGRILVTAINPKCWLFESVLALRGGCDGR